MLVGVSIAVAGPAVAQTDPTDPTVTAPTTVPSTTATTAAPPTTEAPPVTEAPPTTVATTVGGPVSPTPTRPSQATTVPPSTVAEPDDEAEVEEETTPEEAETTTTQAGPASPVSLAPEPEPEEVSKDEGGIGYQTRMNLIIGALLSVAAVVSVLTVVYWRHTRPGAPPSARRPAGATGGVASAEDATAEHTGVAAAERAGPHPGGAEGTDLAAGPPVAPVTTDPTLLAVAIGGAAPDAPAAGEEAADETAEDWEDGVEGVDWEYVEEEEWEEAWSMPEDTDSGDLSNADDAPGGSASAPKVGIIAAEPSFVTAEDLRASGEDPSDMVGRDG